MGRAAIFIDGGYLDYTLRDDFQLAKIDYAKLSEGLAGEKEILRTYYWKGRKKGIVATFWLSRSVGEGEIVWIRKPH